MNRTLFLALAGLSLLVTAAPSHASEGTFQPQAVASPAEAQPGRSFAPLIIATTPEPGSDWRGPVASPAAGCFAGPTVGNNFASTAEPGTLYGIPAVGFGTAPRAVAGMHNTLNNADGGAG